jgi:large subunit ribosomal protein L4e
MKAIILDSSCRETKQVELPQNFSMPVRNDVILKVFEAQKRKQPMGNYDEAGKRHSASSIQRRKRHSWKSSYGRGASRTPRKIMSRDGSSFNLVGAEVANTRGGRRAHPPKAYENLFRKINKKELRLAMNSAFSATLNKEVLNKKYEDKIEKNLPIVFSDEVLKLKTAKFIEMLEKAFGFSVLQERRQRAGKGKARGRRYKISAGLLFVIADDEKMSRKGIDVVKVSELKLRDLAPNGQAGRFAAYTEKSIKQIGEKFK